MPIIRLTGKSFLREHAFGDPYTDPTPVQTSSPIFPGDEILLYHKLSFPTDAGISDITQVKLIDAKLSVIAKKPQVFSEEFNNIFLSTRIFTLDSFAVTFNNLNAPLIPWGTDGYAQFLQVSQDRNFKLPAGDLRRQIKMFTSHPDPATWDYWFYFPIIFRWEYWLPLLGADNDFFNTSEYQNGKNHWWYHYFILNQWKITSRLDVNCLISGVPTIIRSELDLAAATDDVNDYQSSSAWFNESVKTTVIGGTPSNTPCLIKSNEDTEVLASFTKFASWNSGEKGELTGVLWIEPFEGQGITMRTRASSAYPVGGESVFKGLGTALTDDSGTNIVTDSGEYIIVSSGGPGVQLYFDGTNDRIVYLFGIIDYQKLRNIYPGVSKFTLYGRLYDNVRKGEEVKQIAQLVTIPRNDSICIPRQAACPFVLEVFADADDADELKNDKHSFYEYGDALIDSITFKLQKRDANNTTFSDLYDITDNTFGRFFEYGKSNQFDGEDWTDEYGKRYTGAELDFRLILLEYGTGTYRMKVTRIDVYGNITISYSDKVFCLKNYHCNLTNKTVRLKATNTGTRGTWTDPLNLVSYGNGWVSHYRLRGLCASAGSGYLKEFNQYNYSRQNELRPYIDELKPKFKLSIRPIPGWMDWLIAIELLQADELLVTDYNSSNRHPIIDVPMFNEGDFTPRDNKQMNVLSDVEVSMTYGRNNLRRLNV